MRPTTLDGVVGQRHLLDQSQVLARAISDDRVSSMILWGPPGSGKTTIAHVIAQRTRSEFVPFSAVLGGVGELRQVIQAARDRRSYQGIGTLLFVDEIHRFNRAQQDAFLPHVENGTITLIGATTENPSFAVNAAVLSRCKVYRLEALGERDVIQILETALRDEQQGFGKLAITASGEVLRALAKIARGDARRALNLLETAVALLGAGSALTLSLLEQASGEKSLLYDKSGDEHYNVISALIKSLRGSDPDAAIYYLMRMLEAGDDPLFVLRRLIIFASEDVGNADPRALPLAVAADEAFRRLGMPEGIYPIAHTCLYLASCPKSNSVKTAWQAAREAVHEFGSLPVPLKLRNAVTKLMKDDGWGDGYRYAHDHPGSVVPGETYLPDELAGACYYSPSDQGLERQIAERLTRLRTSKKSNR